jgi:hypothetical protein
MVMSCARFGTKIVCAEEQQLSLCNPGRRNSIMTLSVVIQKNVVMRPAALGSESKCGGKCQ